MDARFILLTAVLLGVGLAGCLSDDEPDADLQEDYSGDAAPRIPVAPDQSLFLGTIANDHATGTVGHFGHQVADLHEGAHNLELLDYNDLSEGLMVPSAGFTELHVRGDLAVVSSLTGARAATLLNVSDPANIQILSHIYNLDDNWDARISEDGRFLFVGCQGSQTFDCTRIEAGGEGPPAVVDPRPCVPIATCPGGIAAYDITDPTQPVFRAYLPMGFTHNVYAWQHDDGFYYVANAVANIARFDPESGAFDLASEVIEGVHDIAVQKHPLTGEWLLYTGQGGHMSIWNVDDPMNPELIGSVDDGPPMWHEQTPMPCLIAGRHITIGAGEKGSGLPEPVAVVDTTDPTNPVVLGEWRIPDFDSLTGQNNYRFSLHNVDGNCGGQVAVGHYHAGVWVFDISTPARMAEPVTLAYYQPHQRPVGPAWSPAATAPIGALVSADVPNVWTAQWSADGATLFIPDMTTGLYSLKPTWTYEGEPVDDDACDHEHTARAC